jgi:hypothetical protein
MEQNVLNLEYIYIYIYILVSADSIKEINSATVPCLEIHFVTEAHDVEVGLLICRNKRFSRSESVLGLGASICNLQ